MGINRNFAVKSALFILFMLCTQRQTVASKDTCTYYTDDTSNTDFDEISVIDKEHRFRRQSGDDNVTTPAIPSTVYIPTAAQQSDAPPNAATDVPSQPAVPYTGPTTLQLKRVIDDHVYYKSQTVQLPNDKINTFWVDLAGTAEHKTLSNSHRTAVTINLPFKFPFYGNQVDDITIATGGFLYMGYFIHKFLTQYIAPLMANFVAQPGGYNSSVLYKPFDSKFVVEWRDVQLLDQNSTGTFRFQAILHNNGSIFFVYKSLGIPIVNISDQSHPVKIGLSDAFYLDTTMKGRTGNRRTIHEYHIVTLDTTVIDDNTVIFIHPQPTCNLFSDCDTCVSGSTQFDCRWCSIVNRCSDSVDRHRQKWISAGCVRLTAPDETVRQEIKSNQQLCQYE